MTRTVVGLIVVAGTFVPQAAPASKFHVVLAGGPFKGTYDVTGEPCMAGLQKKGSWHATWETTKDETGKLSAVLVGFDPSPTFGNGLTASAHFGPPNSQVIYEILKPAFNVDDRGATATLTMKGEARATSYVDGSQAPAGSAEITVTCGKIVR
jgi:hypothetical protein